MKSDLIERGVFSRPKNLSVPVNTPRDDLGFALRKDERLAYFTSTRNEGVGEKDIYVIKYLGKEKEVELDFETHDIFNNIEIEKQIEPELEAPADEVVVISGTITSDKTLEPISAEVLVIDPDSKKILAKMDNHSVTGNYQVTVMSNVAYKIKAKSIGYENESKNVTVGAFADQQEYDIDLVLKTENKEENTTETILILDKLYFEYKSSVLMEESYPQLNRVARLMVENENWEVEVGGHTDNIGNVNYNIGLSGDRAKSVVDYLVSRGVPLKRLWWKGYGSVKPISNNSTERGRAKNRRVEFKILKN
jgi:outer membrane protein OmpA-like peptidoglycan-associated protein